MRMGTNCFTSKVLEKIICDGEDGELKGILWQISSPYFVAGLVVENDRVVESAPILKWSIGRQ
jgi:hypothetical protein